MEVSLMLSLMEKLTLTDTFSMNKYISQILSSPKMCNFLTIISLPGVVLLSIRMHTLLELGLTEKQTSLTLLSMEKMTFLDQILKIGEFFDSVFPISRRIKNLEDILIQFDFSTFEKGARFTGPLELGLVSLKGVNLSNLEFINVKWLEKREMLFFTRMGIIDEQMMDKNHDNYDEVSAIYNQLKPIINQEDSLI
jgi:hypothetical protein